MRSCHRSLPQVDEGPTMCEVEGMGEQRLYGDVHGSESHVKSQKHAAAGAFAESIR